MELKANSSLEMAFGGDLNFSGFWEFEILKDSNATSSDHILGGAVSRPQNFSPGLASKPGPRFNVLRALVSRSVGRPAGRSVGQSGGR